MQEEKNNSNKEEVDSNNRGSETSTGRQEQSDPPVTELRGFLDPTEDIEPTLTDGTKAPDKAKEEHQQNKKNSG